MPIFPWKPVKPDPVPTPEPEPTPDADHTTAPWLRIWFMLRSIDMKRIGPALLTIPVIVFFAISGMVAWLWLALRGAWKFIKSIFS
jgi:hypothetical protein